MRLGERRIASATLANSAMIVSGWFSWKDWYTYEWIVLVIRRLWEQRQPMLIKLEIVLSMLGRLFDVLHDAGVVLLHLYSQTNS
jgi:hypothetical protein